MTQIPPLFALPCRGGSDAARAESYRVLRRLPGGAEFAMMTTEQDSDAMVAALINSVARAWCSLPVSCGDTRIREKHGQPAA